MLSFFKKSKLKELVVYSPLTGRTVQLEEVPDPAFSEKAMGDGIAIEPAEGKLYAPFDGTVAQVIKSKHAYILEHSSGVQLLIHVGIDTVSLKGEPFFPLVSTGDSIIQGQPLMEFNLEAIRNAGLPTVTPVIVPVGIESIHEIVVHEVEEVTGGTDAILTLKLKG